MDVLGMAIGAFIFGAAYLAGCIWFLTREDKNEAQEK